MIAMRNLLILPFCAALSAASQPATIDLRVEDKPLSTLIERIAHQCDAGLSVDHHVQDRLDSQVTINARDANWADAMLLLRQQHHLAVRLDGDHLLVEDADREWRRTLVAQRYDIRHLMAAKTAFPGPSLETPEPGGTGSRLLPPIEAASRPEALTLIDLIKQRAAPGCWDDERGTLITNDEGGIITVFQTPTVHTQIATLLRELEGQLLRQVQIRLWRLPKAVVVEGEMIDRAAFAVLAKTLGPPSLAFITGNEQQNHAYAGNQRNAILDADVVQQRYDPIRSTISDGIVLDVQPQSTRAGVLVTCRFDAIVSADAVTAPLREPQGRTILPIELPDRHRDTVRCTLLIADGGAAILRFGERAYAVQAEVFQPAKP